jgi:phosphoribosylglycinamide formyltransferase-1
MRIGVLASGTGTILQSLIDAGLSITAVVVDRPCAATAVAEGAGLPGLLVERSSFGATFDRAAYSKDVAAVLTDRGIELVAIAGFGTVLDPVFFEAFPDRVLNTHPSLLPSFKGWHAVEDALAAGVKVTGCTVHIATAEVDAGPILAQEAVSVLPGDDVATLHERIKAVERRLYPDTIARFSRGELP